MIRSLEITNVGPAPKMRLEFGKRLNLLTGDNGLGKSFLLDIVWWAMTRKWPAEVNPRLIAGKKALPSPEKGGKISFSFTGKSKPEEYTSTYKRKEQSWTGRSGRPANPGLVLYAMSDGGFAVWDPHRNYWVKRGGVDVQERVPAYVFNPGEVWDGQKSESVAWVCNGLIRDWAGWQKEKGEAFKYLTQVLSVLSPSEEEKLEPGELTRIDLDDVRDMPTIRMSYGQDVAVVHASSGMRRIMALAYVLVWAWEEHKRAAKQLGEAPARQVTFLIDEVEAHLHPGWQRGIVPALLSVLQKLADKADVQIITSTHSPLVMASVEPTFDSTKDAWFDLDLKDKRVVLTRQDFVKHGDAANWLTSEAFDLESSRPIEYEKLVQRAAALLNESAPSRRDMENMHDELVRSLNPKDDFLFRWRAICKKKGWLK